MWKIWTKVVTTLAEEPLSTLFIIKKRRRVYRNVLCMQLEVEIWCAQGVWPLERGAYPQKCLEHRQRAANSQAQKHASTAARQLNTHRTQSPNLVWAKLTFAGERSRQNQPFVCIFQRQNCLYHLYHVRNIGHASRIEIGCVLNVCLATRQQFGHSRW